MLKSISNLQIVSITLEKSEGSSENTFNNKVVVSTSFRASDIRSRLKDVNMRMFISVSEDSSKAYDFVSQRYNEFIKQRNNTVSSHQLNDFLRSTLNVDNKGMSYLRSSSPFSPFCTDISSRDLTITNRFSKFGNGSSVPEGTMVYDIPVLELISESDTIDLHEKTISFELPEMDKEILQLSVYGYFYDARVPKFFRENPENNFSLNTKMSLVASKTPLGKKIEFLETDSSNPLLGTQDSSVLNSPDQKTFSVVRIMPDPKISQDYVDLAESYKSILSSYNIGKEYEIKRAISSKNYFSDIWLANDQNDNHRFTFAFDIRAYLKDNSIFPYVYESDRFSRMLLQDSPQSDNFNKSVVSSIQGYRKQISKLGYVPDNHLGTIGRSSDHKMDVVSSKVSTGKIDKVNINTLENEQPYEIKYFQGLDLFTTEDRNNGKPKGSFQYSVECVVVDNSPQLLMDFLEVMIRVNTTTRSILQFLRRRNSSEDSLYDSSTGRLTRDIRNIQINLGKDSTNAYKTLIGNIRTYESFINSLNNEDSTMLSDYYDSLFNSSEGKVELTKIDDFEKIVNSAIFFLRNELRIVPNLSGIQSFSDKRKTNFNFNANQSIKTNVSFLEHTFQGVFDKGKNIGHGFDYLFDNEKKKDSMNYLTVDEFENRVNSEFRKYFTGGKGSAGLIPEGSYKDPSYAYMTPKIIKFPNREKVVQTKYADLDSTAIEYDFDTYGQLFSDIVTTNYQIKDLGVSSPSLTGKAKDQEENNKIYSSLMSSLTQKFSVKINETASRQFSLPRVVKGQIDNTVYNIRDRNRCTNEGGLPLISTIIGGSNTESSATEGYLSGVNNKIKNEDTQRVRGDIDIMQNSLDKKSRSTSIPFVILGKLVLEDSSDFISSERQETYNSLVELSNILNINKSEVEQSLEADPVRELPNQLKSLLVFSSTNDVSTLGTPDGSGGFDVRRPKINEKAGSLEMENIISISDNNKDVPPYTQVDDPMKSYAKFLTFWLNYRQIGVIEYLNGFDTLRPSSLVDNKGNKTKLPIWKKLDSSSIEQFKNRSGAVLCRVRSLMSEDYLNMFRDSLSEKQYSQVIKFFETKSTLNLPTYNQYFYIQNRDDLQTTVVSYNDRVQE